MRVTKESLAEAARQGLLQQTQVEPLWTFLAGRSTFNFLNLGYYLGALLVIGAFSMFMVNAAAFGTGALLAVALAYILGLTAAGLRLWARGTWPVPAGLLVTAAVSIVPLAVYAGMDVLGLWAGDPPGEYHDFHVWIRGDWIWLELATLAAGALALWRVRFPFLVAPLAFVLWYVSMDLTPVFFGEDFSWEHRKRVSLVVGLAILALAFAVDRRARQDYAFWLYLFGLLAFWGGLSLLSSDSELGKLVYCAINVVLLLAGVLLQRRAFLVFGAVGVYLYLGHLAQAVFRDALLFPLALSGLGLGFIALAMQAHRHQAAIERWRTRLLSPRVRAWLPPAR
jgi:hypothetical protein